MRMDNEKFDKGMMVRRSVLGDAHVDRASKNITDFDAFLKSSMMLSNLSPDLNLLVTSWISEATVAQITAIGKAAFWADPTALNSNLLPVKA